MKTVINITLILSVLMFLGCSGRDNNALDTCRDIYQTLLIKRDSTFLPDLGAINTVEEYLNFVEQSYAFVRDTDVKFRSCMKESARISSKEETSKWIQAAVRLGSLAHKWGKINQNPQAFINESKEISIHLEHAINIDLDTIKNFIE